MYYKVQIRSGHFNFADPKEEQISNWIAIYDENDELIKSASVLSDAPLFQEEDSPEDIAQALEDWLSSMIFTSDEQNIKEVVQFLREHSEELSKGKFRHDILQDLKEVANELQRLSQVLIRISERVFLLLEK